MLRLHFKAMVIVGGIVWLTIGMMLLSIGTNLLAEGIVAVEEGAEAANSYPLLRLTTAAFGKAQAAAALLFACGTCLGYFKGRYVLSRSVQRTVRRIATLPLPAPIYRLYGPGYLALLATMVAMGMAIKFIGIANETRSLIDVAVGTALLSGSLEYFRCAYAQQATCSKG